MRNKSYNFVWSILDSRDLNKIKKDFSYHDLTDEEKEELAAILWSEYDYDYCVLSENVMHNKITSSLFSTLIIGTTDKKIELADILRDSIVDYFSKKSSELIEEVTQDYIDDYYHSAGFVKRRFADNGEIYWSKQYG
jgi:hypothetical protein